MATRSLTAPEPPVCEVKLDVLGQPALRADAVAVAQDEHADHELGDRPKGARYRCSKALVPGAGRQAPPSQTRRSGAEDDSEECDHRGGTRRTACP